MMKSNLKTVVSIFHNCMTKFLGGLLILALIWQSLALGETMAIASPLLATSASSISKQVTGKAEQVKGSAQQAIGKSQSVMEDKTGAAKMKVKDDLNEAKIAVDSSAARVENVADKATTAIKDFFGK